MIRGSRKRPRWTVRDRLLMQAFEMYEGSLCSGCGQPKHRSMNPDMDGWYEVRSLTCHACAALETRRRGEDADIPGRKPLAIDVRPASDRPPPWMPDLTGAAGEVDDS